MAGKIKGITIEIGGDTQKLNKALEDVNKKTRDVQSELRQVERLLKLDPKNTELLAQKQKLLADAVENSREKLDRLKTAQEQVNEQFKKGEISEEQYRAFQREVVKAEQELEKFEKQLRETGLTAEQVGKKLQDAGQKMTNVGKNLTMKVTAPLAGLGALATKSAIDFESAFAGVRKTVDATEEEFGALEKGIRKMAKEIPAAATEIAGVAEAAGQLGIETENILNFTRTMIDLGEATNLSADQAATSLARLANITQMPQDQFDRLGSTIVALGNNLATTEAEIVEMGLRLAGAGKQVGLTEAQILGLAGALSSVGIEAQAGGSAFSRVMVDMQLAVETGSERLEQFARVAGMSASEFQRAFKEDAAGAIISFIQGLATAEERGMSAIKVLDDMGITEIRLRDALLRAAGAGDLFNESIKIGTQAWEENIALTKEAEQRYGTTESQLEIFKNQIVDLGISLGEIIIPALTQLVESLRPVVDWFASLSPEMQKTIVAVAGLAAAIGPLLMVLGPIVSTIGTLVVGLGAMSTAMAGGASIVAGLTAGFPALGAAITLLTGPIGIVIAAIAGLVAAGVLIYKNWDEIKEALDRVWGAIVDFFTKTIPEAIEKGLKWFSELPGKVAKFMNELPGKIGHALGVALGNIIKFGIDAINWAIAEVPKFIESMMKFIRELPGKMWEQLVAALGRVREWGNNLISWARSTLPGVISNIVSFFRELPGRLLEIGKDMVRGLWDGIKSMVGWIKDKISDFVGGIVDGVKGVLGIRSPSRIFMDIGENLSLGLAEGIRGAKAAVDSALAGLISPQINVGLAGAGSAGMGAITNTFVIQNMSVRSDQDIKLIAKELHNLQQQSARGRGMR